MSVRGRTRTHEQRRAQIHAALSLALKQAGDEGMAAEDLGHTVGINARIASYHCHHMPLAIRALTKAHSKARWFHLAHKDACDAYVVRMDNYHCDRTRWSPKTEAAILEAVEKAGEAAATLATVSQAIGINERTCGMATSSMADRGLIKRRIKHNLALLYPLSVDVEAIVERERQEKAAKPKKERPKKVRPVKPVKQAVVKPAKKPVLPAGPTWKKTGLGTVPNGRAVLKATGIIVPDNVKRTACPTFPDTRFTVDKVQPVFSAMRPGEYLGTGSAVERAYLERALFGHGAEVKGQG